MKLYVSSDLSPEQREFTIQGLKKYYKEYRMELEKQMRYLEDIYKTLGYNQPFKQDGSLTKWGEQAEYKLLELLQCCADIGLIENFSADRFDRVIADIMRGY